jgi:precorrin-8X/cobalt-precorrin-8 methylmutase
MYLQDALVDADGRRHRMTGIVPGDSTLLGRRLTLGYREVQARRDTPLARSGQTLRGHEFHWSVCDAPPDEMAAYAVLDGSERVEGYAASNVLASYVHLHFASDPGLAPRFVESCSKTASLPPRFPINGSGGAGLPPDPLSHPRPPSGRAGRESHLPPLQGGDGRLPEPGTLLRQHGLPPGEIEALSRHRIDGLIADRLPATEPERGLVARIVYAAGDPELVAQVALVGDPIAGAVAALADGATLIVDVGMVAAGISRSSLSALDIEMRVVIQTDGIEVLAARHGITRSAAGILALSDALNGSVVAIGNAPTALLALLDLAATRGIRPAAVVGMPVGFVAAEESKELLLAAGLPCIVIRGTRGGSPLAAATVNYLLDLAVQSRKR